MYTAVKTATLGGSTRLNLKYSYINMDIIDILHPNAVRAAHSVGNKKRLFQDLAAVAGQIYGISPEIAIEALIERETLGPTGVGRGVALPHARLDSIDQIVGCFMKLDRPVEFDAVDRQPVDLVFALFAPLSSGVEHLRALALVSRTLRDTDVCMKLRNNEDPAILLAVLQEGPASVAA